MFEKLMTLDALSGSRIWLRTHQPFNAKTTWYEFLKKMSDKITGSDVSDRAASVSYNLILAVFPTIIFLFTLIPYIPIPSLDTQIMDLFRQVLPGDTFESAYGTIKDIISRPRSGVLSIGFLLALFSATSGMVALMRAFNASHQTDEERGFLPTRLTATGLTLLLAFALVVAIVVLVVGGVVIDYLSKFGGIFNNDAVYYALKIARYLVVFAVFTGVVSAIYRFGPDVNMKWAFVTPGAIFASVLIVLTTYAFSYYVSNFGSYNKVYGSIGTLIALMVWINLVMLLMILGFEMNVALYNLEGDKNPSVKQKTTNLTSDKTKNATLSA